MKTKTRLTKIASGSLLFVGLVGLTAFSRNPNRTLADRGTVASVNTSQSMLTITETKSHQPQVFTWNSDTRFLERGDHLWSKSKPVMADQLQPGEPVKIRYQKENDQLLAKTIVISHSNKGAAAASQPHS